MVATDDMLNAISRSSIIAAIAAGRTDVFAIARHLGVNHSSYTLRSTLKRLADDGVIVAHGEDGSTKTFTIDGLGLLRDRLDRERQAADLKPGDRIYDASDSQIKAIKRVDGYAPYMRVEFADGSWITPTLTERFELHND